VRYDCSEVRNQLARWNQTSSEWDDKKSKEVERDYIEPLESGINRMAEMLYEVTDFFVTIESKLAELEEAREWQEQEF
jgi:cob(I)alamin adenosyltransferase